jgi:hypothetical protein
MSAFPSTIIRLIPLLGSPVDDEALNAVRALEKHLNLQVSISIRSPPCSSAAHP